MSVFHNLKKSEKDDSIITACHCGGAPILTESSGIISKEVYKRYKCQKCGQEGEMFWTTEERCRATWEHTLKGIATRKPL